MLAVPKAAAAPVPISASEPLVDMDRLLEFAGGSSASLVEITDLYLTQTEEQLARITKAMDESDPAAIIRLAHSSAGASGVCGIMAMERWFRDLEEIGKQGTLDAAPSVLQKLRRNFGAVKDFLLNSRKNLPLS